MKKFWYVFNTTKRGLPNVKHHTRAAAIKEAQRLANMQPGEQFIVLSAVVHVAARICPATATALV